jgi:5-methylcytosine-specific restriction endonuclease McrA
MVVNSKIWRNVFERDKGICQYCGCDLLGNFSAYWSVTVDHIVARCENGSDEDEKLVLSCPACNGMLSRAKDLTTFEKRKEYITERRNNEMSGYQDWYNQLRVKKCKIS